jgi:hypothetical protein
MRRWRGYTRARSGEWLDDISVVVAQVDQTQVLLLAEDTKAASARSASA